MKYIKNRTHIFLSLIMSSLSMGTTFCHKTKDLPIVLVHGILSDAYGMKPTETYIAQHFPGRYVKSVNIGTGVFSSFTSMYHQVDHLAEEIQNDPELENGYIIIAHSQGGLVSRYFIERYNLPQCYRYISWGSPQCGVCGTPGTFDNTLTWINKLESLTYKLLYSSLFQKYISVAGYWHDTLHHHDYLSKCNFLPLLNNEVNHPLKQKFKDNILSLDKMVLVNSTQEEIIEPRASCHFGYYRIGTLSVIEDFFSSAQYKQNLIGLKTLYDDGRLVFKMAECTHANYQEDEKNFIENTLPYLK